MDTVIFVNATIGFSENLFLVTYIETFRFPKFPGFVNITAKRNILQNNRI